MRTRSALFALGAAALAAPACNVIEWNFYFVEVVSTSTTSGSTTSTTSTTLCAPGAKQACYDGPAGTEGQGICKAGAQTCAPDGASWGACVGEVLPAPIEDCASGQDQNCDGKVTACKGAVEWAKGFGDAGYQEGYSVAVDGAGNVFVTGVLGGTVDFGGGPLASAGGGDVFIVKLDESGSHLWSKRFGDSDSQIGMSVAVDASGNVLLAGTFAGTVDFGGGPLTSAGGGSIFVTKLDANGSHLWSKGFGEGIVTTDQSAVAVDTSGNVVLAGTFRGAVDFGGGPLVSAGDRDIYAAKLDASGGYLWGKRFGDANIQGATGLAGDSSGNVVVTGWYTGSVDFGGGPLPGAVGNEVFVAKLDASGAHVWSKGFGGASADNAVGQGIAVDGAGNVLLAGWFSGSVDFGGGSLTGVATENVFVAKLDAGGVHQWSKGLGDAESQQGRGIAVDGADNVLLTGWFTRTIDFGGGPLASAGKDDIFVAKLDAGGGHLWSKRFGDTLDQQAVSVAVDASGAALITGHFAGNLDFGGGVVLNGAGGTDIFVAKFSP